MGGEGGRALGKKKETEKEANSAQEGEVKKENKVVQPYFPFFVCVSVCVD